MAGGATIIEASPVESRVTQETARSEWASTSRRRTRSASPGLSSISRYMSGSVIHCSSSRGRHAHPIQKSFSSFTAETHSRQGGRFADVTVGPQFVTALNVLCGLRRAEDHDRDPAQSGVGFHFGQDGTSILAGQVQVQQHQVGTSGGGVFALAAQIGHGFGPIADRIDIGRPRALGQGVDGQVQIGGIVIHQQESRKCACHHAGSCLLSKVSGRQGEVEDRASAFMGYGLDPAAMPFDDLLADRQPDAIARIFGASVQAVEDDKDVFRVLGRYANAVVGHRKDPFGALACSAEM